MSGHARHADIATTAVAHPTLEWKANVKSMIGQIANQPGPAQDAGPSLSNLATIQATLEQDQVNADGKQLGVECRTFDYCADASQQDQPVHSLAAKPISQLENMKCPQPD